VTTIDKLHGLARRAIESGEQAFSERAREAAEYLAKAQQLGATQRQSAEAIGKSAGWVNTLLKWRDAGYKTLCPFPDGDAKRRVQRAKQKNEPKKSRPATSAEQAQAQTAKAKAEQVKAEAQKAKAEASRVRAEAKKARSENAKAQAQARERFHETFSGFFGGHRERKKIHSGPRELLIKALGMLGSEHVGERASAAVVVEKQRKLLGMAWDELIVPAEADDQEVENEKVCNNRGKAA
jgi:hypothetical protein